MKIIQEFLTSKIEFISGDTVKELFNALINSSPIGMYIIQNGVFKFTSPRFAEILGYSKEELKNSRSLDYVHGEDRDMVKANAIAALKAGDCRPYEFRVIAKNGDLRWVLETIIRINYHGNRATLGNFMDITERKKAQEEMKVANEKLTLMVQRFEKQNKLDAILTEMRDLLQACSTSEEIPSIIMCSMKKLFPDAEGALFLISPSHSDLESVARWGGFPDDIDDNVFTPDECWGLRRGHAHVVDDTEIGPICPHLKHRPNTAYVCLPLMAKGDVLGLLHLRSEQSTQGTDSKRTIMDLKDTAVTISEYLSLAIANVKLSESLSRQSINDPLSGLYNRRHMEESLKREIERAARKHASIGVIMADLDHFKKFNDNFGHAAGDMVISKLGKFLTQNIRGADIACRYGGEEFLLILPDCSAEDTFKHADDLRKGIKKLELLFQGRFIGTITISMGVASYPADGEKMDDLLRAADTALYKAKQGGRDRVIQSAAILQTL